jgi:hypothetical protein
MSLGYWDRLEMRAIAEEASRTQGRSLNSENSAFFLGHVPKPIIDEDEPMDILMGLIKSRTDSGRTVEQVQVEVRETAMFKSLSQSQKDFIEFRMAR